MTPPEWNMNALSQETWAAAMGSMVLFWSIAYILIIRLGFRDKACGVPLAAVCANLTWEGLYAFLFTAPEAFVRYGHRLWFTLDVIILVLALRFAASGSKATKIWIVAGLVLGFFGNLSIHLEFVHGPAISGCLINLMMSILFVEKLLRERNVLGQSIYIATAKWLGTLVISSALLVVSLRSPLLTFLAVATFAFDVLYLALLVREHRRLGVNVWTHI